MNSQKKYFFGTTCSDASTVVKFELYPYITMHLVLRMSKREHAKYTNRRIRKTDLLYIQRRDALYRMQQCKIVFMQRMLYHVLYPYYIVLFLILFSFAVYVVFVVVCSQNLFYMQLFSYGQLNDDEPNVIHASLRIAMSTLVLFF